MADIDPDSVRLYVTWCRNANTGLPMVLWSGFEGSRRQRYVTLIFIVARMAHAVRMHRLFGVKKFPIDFDSVVTDVYEVEDEEGTSTDERTYLA